MKKSRALIPATFFLMLMGSAAAQTGGSGALLDMFNALMINGQVNSWSDVMLYIVVPFAGLFAIMRFISYQAFKMAETDSIEGITDSSSLWISLAVAGGGTLLMGGLSLMVIGLLGIVGLGWGVWTIFGKATTSGLRTGQKLGAEGSKAHQKIMNQIRSTEEEIEETEQEEQDLKNKEDETESEEQQGANPERIANEIEMEEQELKDIISRTESIEQHFEKILSEIKSQEDKTMREEKKEQQELGEVEQKEAQDLKDLKNELSKVKNSNAAGNPKMAQMLGNEIQPDLKNIREDLAEFHESLEFERDTHEDIQFYTKALKRLKKSLTELDTEEKELEMLANELEEEEVNAEKIAKQYKDEADWEKIKKEEQETQQLLEEAEKAIKEKQRIKKELQQEIEELEEEKQYDQKEVQEIMDVAQEFQEEENILEQFRQFIDSSGLEDKTKQKLETELGQIEQMIEQIEGEAQELSQQL